jgi:predicted nucleic acid-binding protein
LIFIDTGFLFALYVAGDKRHERVQLVFESYRGRRLGELLLTTNLVVAEAITLFRKKSHPDPNVRHDLATRIGAQLLAENFGSVHRVSEAEERAAFELFSKHRDQDYSFVDCTSFVVMEGLGIREALAVDSDFTHRFVATPGPL